MTFVFNMFDATSNRTLLSKNLQIIDDGVTTSTRGLALLSITESDTLDLNTSFYNYSVTALDSDNSYIPAYTNTYYGISGSLEVRNDVRPVLTPTTVIDSWWVYKNTDPNALYYDFYSGSYPGNASFKSNEALHSAAIYMTNFTGKVVVQGTLANSPAGPGSADRTFSSIRDIQSTSGQEQFASLSELDYVNFTGVDYVNWSGNWTYVQIKWTPQSKTVNGVLSNFFPSDIPSNPTYGQGKPYYPLGSVDKVLYRS
jgi:hypothetical protein